MLNTFQDALAQCKMIQFYWLIFSGHMHPLFAYALVGEKCMPIPSSRTDVPQSFVVMHELCIIITRIIQKDPADKGLPTLFTGSCLYHFG